MDEILHTKLRRPHSRGPLVQRAELIARLDVATGHRLTLLAAPAGYGKTTLLSAWCAAQSGRPLAWLTLDDGDNDPARFWRYVCAALRPLVPWLPVPPAIGDHAVPAALLNALAELPHRCVLVLDDYHTISAPAVHTGLISLLEQAPGTLGLVVSTRDAAPLPLARLRAHNDLAELRSGDLRFTPAEIAALLADGEALPAATLAQIAERTGGWPAGLHLALLALPHDTPPGAAATALAAGAGGARHVGSFLAAEVLPALPERLQRFLLETSILGELTADLCEATTGDILSAAHLDALEQAELFVERISSEPARLRLLPIVAEALRDEAVRRYAGTRIRTLHARAARWLAANGPPEQAIDATLAAEDFGAAAELIEAFARERELPTGIYTMRRWVEALPPALWATHPHMCLAYATALLFSEDRRAPALLPRIEAPLELAERAWLTSGDRAQLGAALSVRSIAAWWQGQPTDAVVAAGQALALLPDDRRQWRASCLLNQGMGEYMAGRLDQAETLVQAAHNDFIRAENSYGQRAAAGLLGDVALLRSDARQAAHIYAQCLAEAADDPSDQGSFLLRLARIDYHHNDLDAAGRRIEQALAVAEQHVDLIGPWTSDVDMFAPACVLRARILAARGDSGAAQELLAHAVARMLRYDDRQLHRELQAEQARYALECGDLVAVQRWVTAAGQPGAPVFVLQQEREALVVARWLIAQGEAAAAVPAVAHWLARAEKAGRVFGAIQARIVLALAQFSAACPAEADATLLAALQRARPNQLVRLFLDEGPALGALLERQLARLAASDPLHAFAQQLLAGLPGAPRPSQSNVDRFEGLGEPLTRQEQRVLQLVGAGMSNPEIAAELVVSVNTIKTQVQSIYRKLGINSRREARALTRNRPGGLSTIRGS